MKFIKLNEICKHHSHDEGINIEKIESYFVGNGIEIDSYDLVLTMGTYREIKLFFRTREELEIGMYQLELTR